MYALKIETAGIQRYIFSSNKLKVNLGASYIIEHLLYKEILRDAVGSPNDLYITNWFKDEERDRIIKNDEFGIGYIGGGNALLYASDDIILKEIDKRFKKMVLQAFPGLEIYSGIINDYIPNAKDEEFIRINEELNEVIKTNRSKHPFINFTPNHGFYNKCGISGDVAIGYWPKEDLWISDEVLSKIQYSENLEQNETAENYSGHIANKKHCEDLLILEQEKLCTFPIDFGDLSDNMESKYIAVVHIDGNNLGNAFINSKGLGDTQTLSQKIRKLGTEALQKTIQEGIIDRIKEKEDEREEKIRDEQISALPLIKLIKDKKYSFHLGGIKLKVGKDKKYPEYIEKLQLPIRPIITGGDDITFVCEGSLGIPLAKLFLQNFHELGKETGVLDGNVHACAGVAIVKQKYPFYRAYKLSEELIKEAKKSTRNDTGGSFLSFMIAGYGTGTSLEDLKNKYARPELYCGTFSVTSDVKSLKELEIGLKQLNEEKDGKHKIPRNKLMQVREALINGNLDIVWPEIESRIGKDWKPLEKKELNFEAIEILDFYEKSYLKN